MRADPDHDPPVDRPCTHPDNVGHLAHRKQPCGEPSTRLIPLLHGNTSHLSTLHRSALPRRSFPLPSTRDLDANFLLKLCQLPRCQPLRHHLRQRVQQRSRLRQPRNQRAVHRILQPEHELFLVLDLVPGRSLQPRRPRGAQGQPTEVVPVGRLVRRGPGELSSTPKQNRVSRVRLKPVERQGLIRVNHYRHNQSLSDRA